MLRRPTVLRARAEARLLTNVHVPARDHAPTASHPAHHAPDGTFRNPWPDSEPRSVGAVLRWSLQRSHRRRAPTPPRGSFPTAVPEIVQPRAARGVATATWVGHSSVLLQVDGHNILADPVWSERAFPVQWAGPRRVMPATPALDALPPLDLILVSHSHYDHFDKRTIQRLARQHPDATWIAPLRLGAYLQDFGVRSIAELDWWASLETKGVRITATPARHFSARRLGDRNKTLWCGYALEVGGRRLYFAGDTGYHPEFAAIGARCGPFDLLMIPIGAYEPRWFMHPLHVNPEEAVQACIDLHSAHPDRRMPVVLALHWGTFRLTDEAMDEPPRRMRELWRERGLEEGRLWIAAFGETRAW